MSDWKEKWSVKRNKKREREREREEEKGRRMVLVVGGKIHLSKRQLNGIKEGGNESRSAVSWFGAGRSGAAPVGRSAGERRPQRCFQNDAVIKKNDASSQPSRSGTFQKTSVTTMMMTTMMITTMTTTVTSQRTMVKWWKEMKEWSLLTTMVVVVVVVVVVVPMYPNRRRNSSVTPSLTLKFKLQVLPDNIWHLFTLKSVVQKGTWNQFNK